MSGCLNIKFCMFPKKKKTVLDETNLQRNLFGNKKLIEKQLKTLNIDFTQDDSRYKSTISFDWDSLYAYLACSRYDEAYWLKMNSLFNLDTLSAEHHLKCLRAPVITSSAFQIKKVIHVSKTECVTLFLLGWVPLT